MPLIGVTGYAQHGKDTVAALLVDEYGFTRTAFADSLKDMALVLDPYIDCDVNGFRRLSAVVGGLGWEGAKQYPEVRRFLQVLGTEAIRDMVGPDTWVDVLFRRTANVDCLVIPDVRFPNEADAVMDTGYLIGVQRVNLDGTPFDNGIGTDHPSEQNIEALLNEADVVFTSPSVEDLKAQVRKWLADEGVL